MNAGIPVLEISLPASTSCAAAADIVVLFLTLLDTVQGLLSLLLLPPAHRGGLQRPRRDTRPPCADKAVLGSSVILFAPKTLFSPAFERAVDKRRAKQPWKILVGQLLHRFHTSGGILCGTRLAFSGALKNLESVALVSWQSGLQAAGSQEDWGLP